MNSTTHCDFCGAALDLGQEFVFQVESLRFVDDPVLLEHIRNLPQYHQGEPLRLCGQCRAGVEQNQRDIEEEERLSEIGRRRTLLLYLVVLLSVLGLVVAAKLFR